jgi:hypothetical protein
MGLYDDGGIEFAQEQFKASRAYKEKVAKDQEKFTKGLFALDTVIKGASFLIDRNAEKLDADMIPQKAKYQALNTSAANWRTQEQERIESGKSVMDYLSDMYYEDLETQAAEDYGYLNKSQYAKALREQADILAKSNVDEYQALIKAANNIPTFEDFTEFYEDQADIPRNLFSWITKGAKKVFKRETEDTLKIKNAKANDALYGTKMFDKYKNLSSSIHAYELATGKGKELTAIIDGLHLKTGGAMAEFTKEVEGSPVYDYEKGTITKEKSIWVATSKPNGTPEYLPQNKHLVSTSVKLMTDDEKGFLSEEAIKNLLSEVKIEYRGQITDILYPDSTGKVTASQVAMARKYLGENTYMYDIDGSNMKSIEDGFEKYQSSRIMFMKIDNNGIMNYQEGYDESTGIRIAIDPDMDGIYSFDPSQRDRAEAAGLTSDSLRSEFTNKVLGQTAQPDVDPFMNATDIATLLDDKNQNLFNDFVNLDPDGDFYDVFKSKLEADDSDFVNLGTVDLSQAFADFGFSKQIKTIFYDRQNNRVIFK